MFGRREALQSRLHVGLGWMILPNVCGRLFKVVDFCCIGFELVGLYICKKFNSLWLICHGVYKSPLGRVMKT